MNNKSFTGNVHYTRLNNIGEFGLNTSIGNRTDNTFNYASANRNFLPESIETDNNFVFL